MIQIAAPSQGTQSILQQAKHASEITAFISLSWGGQRHTAVSNVAGNSNSTNLNSNKNKRYLTGINKLQCACWRTALINTCSYNRQHYKHRKSRQELHVGILVAESWCDTRSTWQSHVSTAIGITGLQFSDARINDLNSIQFLHLTISSAKCGISSHSKMHWNVELYPIYRHILGGICWGTNFFTFRNPIYIAACEEKKDCGK